ncbi:hypothetical protein BDV28DRAFT_150835 [Aspergillus coremiiformis]|uniref:Phosphatidylglycerol/phosphatidylinositol transfer protein n=1 Tax=Aspergillus coremiiformis TaxID=138285 RepID=A0A5N6YYP3_9EURO|nr:hypothetical protein BDV28DRAFT_150835 [Aspergillus coremiiformis]
MKTPYVVAVLAATVSAQTVNLTVPAPGQQITAGQDLVVQIQRPTAATGSMEVAVVIGMASCAAEACWPPSSSMGSILYSGPYDPEYRDPMQSPFQNFTVKVPDNLAKGPAQVNVAHMTIIGASAAPFMETRNQSVVIV